MVNHEAVLVGSPLLGPGPAPQFLTRTDQAFLPAILAELRSEAGRDALAGQRSEERNAQGLLRLHQPVHRAHHLVLLDAHCRIPGRPRLDPSRIDGAGLVIRRLRGANGSTVPQAWMDAESDLKGWVSLNGPDANLDPEPERRRVIGSGNTAVDRRLAFLKGNPVPLAERTSPLFVAPPDVCVSAGRTLLYGLVPVASAEHSGTPDETGALDAETLRNHLPLMLKRGSARDAPAAGRTLTRDYERELPEFAAGLRAFASDLRQLVVELDAFGDGEHSRRLFAALQELRFEDVDGGVRRGGDLLRAAAEVIILAEEDATFVMPARLPAVSSTLETRFLERVGTLLQTRLKALTAGEMRFDRRGARYVARAFMRVRRDDGCPPDLIWSEPSEPFEVVPWYETGKLPPVKIALPDATDRGFLKGLKPNVAFEMPESLFNMIGNADLQGLIDGDKPSEEPKLGLGWICGFNIPLITLCAFFVLNIFLGLLNIVFFWLAFIKICIPFPKPEGSDSG